MSCKRLFSIIVAAGAVLNLAVDRLAAEIITAYTSSRVESVAPDVVAAGVTGAGLVHGAGVTIDGSGSEFIYHGWTEATLANATAGNDYFEWGFSSPAAWNLSNLGLNFYRSGNGPSNASLQLKTNGGTFNEIYSSAAVPTSLSSSLSLSLAGYTNVTSAVFRLYAYNANAYTGTFRAANAADLKVNGVNHAIVLSGTPVPEPSTLALLAVFLAMLAVLRRYW